MNHPFWDTPIYGNLQVVSEILRNFWEALADVPSSHLGGLQERYGSRCLGDTLAHGDSGVYLVPAHIL